MRHAVIRNITDSEGNIMLEIVEKICASTEEAVIEAGRREAEEHEIISIKSIPDDMLFPAEDHQDGLKAEELKEVPGRLMIESVRCGIDEGGMACGPVSGAVVGEVEIRTEDDETFFMLLADVEGIPHFYKTPHSTFEMHTNLMEYLDYTEELKRYFIRFDEEPFGYSDIFDHPDYAYYQIYRFLIYLVGSSWEETDAFEHEVVGKYLDEIEIPMSEDEEEYLEEQGDDE